MKMVSAAAVLALVPALASAADLPRRDNAPFAPAPAYSSAPAFTWTGVYAGLNAGGNWGSFSGGAGNLWGSPNGGVIGGTLGYNYQINQLLLGVEGDWDIDGARGRKAIGVAATGFGKLTNVMTLRGRAGYAADRALVYATGGYAGGTVAGSLLDTTLPAGGQYFSTSGWRSGYALGVGVEYAFTDKISAKAEYLYTSLAKQNVFAPPRATNAGVNENTIRGGVNYHF